MTKEEVFNLLKEISYPGFSRDIVSFGILKDIIINDKDILVELDIRSAENKIVVDIINSVEEKLKVNYRDYKITINNVAPPPGAPTKAPHEQGVNYLPHVKYKIAVASGKGGVGKSTVAVNLAVALAKLGHSVGLLDADIYGPSIPLMLGVTSRPGFDRKQLIPIEKYGVKLMSLGFLMEGNEAVIWRGALVTKAIQQLMQDVKWGNLDYMIFDMPPGTGDAQLTLSQSIKLDGAVIVSTPQDVALIDAIKGVKMFKKVDVPILGIVENMSYFLCPHCNERTDIFSSGGAKRECEKMGETLLGEIPIDTAIRIGGDKGKPVTSEMFDSPISKAFMEIAQNIDDKLK